MDKSVQNILPENITNIKNKTENKNKSIIIPNQGLKQDTVSISDANKTNKNNTQDVNKNIIGAIGIIIGAISTAFGVIKLKKSAKRNEELLSDLIKNPTRNKEAEKIYKKIDSIIHKKNPTLNSEQIDKTLEPKAKEGAWDKNDAKDYYTQLEKESDINIENELIKNTRIEKQKIHNEERLKTQKEERETEEIRAKIDQATFNEDYKSIDVSTKNLLKSFAPRYAELPEGKTLNEFSITEKKHFIDFLTETGNASSILTEHGIIDKQILPKNEEEYISMLNSCVTDIKNEMKPLNQAKIDRVRMNLKSIRTSDLYGITPDKISKIEQQFPEIFNGERKLNAETLKSLRDVYANPEFEKLSEDDKHIVTIATLLHNSSKKPINDNAFEGYILSQKLGFSKKESEKLANIIKHSNFAERFMDTHNKVISIQRKYETLSTTDRALEFYTVAKDLREDNSFEMAQMLYSTKMNKGATRFLDKKLKTEVDNIKSYEEILPQTDKETILKYAKEQIIEGHKIRVVKASEIPNFYAYVHTHNFGSLSGLVGNSEEMKLANFSAFELPMNDKIICNSFVGRNHYTTAGTSRSDKNGLILNAPNGKVYINSANDINSLSKNENDLIYEFGYTPKKLNEKDKKPSFYIKNATDYMQGSLQISQKQYAERIDKLKQAAGNKVISYETMQKYDPELTKGIDSNMDYILDRNCSYSESILSNPTVVGIFQLEGSYTNKTLIEYAEKNDLPLVIFDPKYER